MRAAIIREFGSIDAVVPGEFPAPIPTPKQVLIEVQAAPINYVDLLVIGGKYQFLPQLPFVPGKGPAGVVSAVGAEVTDLAVGDRVLAMVEQGGYAEQIVAAPSQCYRLPDTMSFVDWARWICRSVDRSSTARGHSRVTKTSCLPWMRRARSRADVTRPAKRRVGWPVVVS